MIPGKAHPYSLFVGLALCLLAACQRSPSAQAPALVPVAPPVTLQTPPTPAPAPVATPTRAPKRSPKPRPTPSPRAIPVPPRRPPGLGARKELAKKYLAAAAWAKIPKTEAWTAAVIKSVRAFREDLDSARDIEEFCPGYEKASRQSREVCWLRLVSQLAKYESGFNVHEKYLEPMGMVSVGLLQLSDGECILPRNRKPDLENPVHNLKCGVAIMARLIRRDHYIEGPIWARGAAAYWSTLRPPYRFLRLRLGKKPFVLDFTKTYLSF